MPQWCGAGACNGGSWVVLSRVSHEGGWGLHGSCSSVVGGTRHHQDHPDIPDFRTFSVYLQAGPYPRPCRLELLQGGTGVGNGLRHALATVTSCTAAADRRPGRPDGPLAKNPAVAAAMSFPHSADNLALLSLLCLPTPQLQRSSHGVLTEELPPADPLVATVAHHTRSAVHSPTVPSLPARQHA